jgi:hypothetical protein
MDAIADFYLYVYDGPDGQLNPTVVAAGKQIGRFIDRTPCNVSTVVPQTVTLVAWSQRNVEGPAVQASWNKLQSDEMARRMQLGINSSAQYTLPATQQPLTSAPLTSSATPNPTTTTSSSATTSTATTATTATTVHNSGSETVSTPENLEYCGPLPLPCWSLALFGGLLLACVLLLACSAWLCVRERRNNAIRYRAMRPDEEEESN